MAESRDKLRVNLPHTTPYKPLHENLEGEVGKRLLTDGGLGAVGKDSGEGGELARGQRCLLGEAP
jgi:hypothetical protein